MEAGKRSLGDILNPNRIIEIPFFQRSYVWDEDNWERFLEDIDTLMDGGSPYFMGPIILKQEKTTSDKITGDVRSLIDGQQRLTSILLFLKCAAKKFEDDSEYLEKILHSNDNIIILQHNHNDKEIFEAIINDELNNDIKKKYKDNGNKVLKCYEYFEKNINLGSGVRNWKVFLSSIYFVGIDLGEKEDAQQIFDTLNSLGVSLTTAELLKNLLFNYNSWDLYQKTWQKSFEVEERPFWDTDIGKGRHKRKNIDFLLQSFLLLKPNKHGKPITVDKLYDRYKDYITHNGISPGNEDFINDIINKSEVYRENINYEKLREHPDLESFLYKINLVTFAFPVTPIIPYLMFILTNVMEESERDQIFDLLVNYFVRRTICREGTRSYGLMFNDLISKKVKTLEGLKQQFMRRSNIARFPNDEQFKQGFIQSKLTNAYSKSILYLLELSMREAKDSTALLPFSNYEVEHIMPKQWEKNWPLAEGDERARDDKKLTMGNLTIISPKLNNSIKNDAWEVKKQGRGNRNGLLVHAKGLRTFDDDRFLGSDTWDENKIQERGEFLYEQAVSIWPDITE